MSAQLRTKARRKASILLGIVGRKLRAARRPGRLLFSTGHPGVRGELTQDVIAYARSDFFGKVFPLLSDARRPSFRQGIKPQDFEIPTDIGEGFTILLTVGLSGVQLCTQLVVNSSQYPFVFGKLS